MDKQAISVTIMGETTPLEFPIDTERIVIDDKRITEIDLSTVGKFPKLRDIEVSVTQAFELDLAPLADCPLLERVSISGLDAKTIHLAPLKTLVNLREIIINNNRLQTMDLTPLSKMHKLTELSLCGNGLKTIDLTPLSGHESLEVLRLSENALRRINLTPLKDVPSLEILDLSRNKLAKVSLNSLRRCSNLDELDLSGNELTVLDLRPLASCRLLRKLILSENRLKEINLEPVSDMFRLDEIRLDNNQLTKIDLSAISTCINLRVLDMSNNKIAEANLAPLRRCTKIEIVGLGGNELKHLDLEPVSSLGSLQHLVFSSNNLTEINLYSLSNCPNLLRLSIEDNPIQHLDLYPLAFCQKLAKLSIDMIDRLIILGHAPDGDLFQVDLTPLYMCKMLRSVDITKRDDIPVGASVILSDLPEFIQDPPKPLLKFLKHPMRRYGLPSDALLHTIGERGFEYVRDHLLAYLKRHEYGEWPKDQLAYWDAAIPSLVNKLGWANVWALFVKIMTTAPSSAQPQELQALFRKFNLQPFAGYDGDVAELLQRNWDWETGMRELRKILRNKCKKQLLAGGSTLFFRQAAFDESDPAQKELKDILNRKRIEEIKSIEIFDYNGCFDLRPLWLTSIGFEFLWQQKFWLFTGASGMQKIISFFENRGFILTPIKVAVDREIPDSSSRPISERLRLFVYTLAIENASNDARTDGFSSLADAGRSDLNASLAASIVPH